MTRALIVLIKIYQKYISPLHSSRCRFYPSCSRYCLESVNKHGVCLGLFCALKRVIRCHPFSPGGYDPVK